MQGFKQPVVEMFEHYSLKWRAGHSLQVFVLVCVLVDPHMNQQLECGSSAVQQKTCFEFRACSHSFTSIRTPTKPRSAVDSQWCHVQEKEALLEASPARLQQYINKHLMKS